jgi:hypothetical protein
MILNQPNEAKNFPRRKAKIFCFAPGQRPDNVVEVLCPYKRASNFLSLWLYIPIFGLGRLHETFRFISVTRSRTVGRTPSTGDQLVARPLLTAPGDCDDDDGEVGGMNGVGRGN